MTPLTTERRVKRRKLKKGEFWCLFPKGRQSQPLLVHKPGPHFESNAKHFGHRIGIVRLVKA